MGGVRMQMPFVSGQPSARPGGALFPVMPSAADRDDAEERALADADATALGWLAFLREVIGDRDRAVFLATRAAQHGHTVTLKLLAKKRADAGDDAGADLLYRRAADTGDAEALSRLALRADDVGD